MPLLSVVTPVFDPGPYLEVCLDSVAGLEVEHEHVVVDAGSTHAVNKGLAMARGSLVTWINGDDEVVAEGMRRAVEHLHRSADCQVVYGGLDFTDADGTV